MTETALMRNAEQVLAQLEGLRDMGVTLAIDDFGTGYSNFAYLRKLPARAVKLDRSFVSDLDPDPEARPLARAMIGIAHDLGLRVVAEGVENQGTLDVLRAWGCDDRPMTPAALRRRFTRYQRLRFIRAGCLRQLARCNNDGGSAVTAAPARVLARARSVT